MLSESCRAEKTSRNNYKKNWKRRKWFRWSMRRYKKVGECATCVNEMPQIVCLRFSSSGPSLTGSRTREQHGTTVVGPMWTIDVELRNKKKKIENPVEGGNETWVYSRMFVHAIWPMAIGHPQCHNRPTSFISLSCAASVHIFGMLSIHQQMTTKDERWRDERTVLFTLQGVERQILQHRHTEPNFYWILSTE